MGEKNRALCHLQFIYVVFIPPGGLNMFTVLMLFFYYSIGSTLERTWGTFRYNVYIFSGMLFSVLGGFLVYFLDCFMGAYNPVSAASIGTNLGAGISTYYINLSIFLAFAACYCFFVKLYSFFPWNEKF